MQTFQMTYRRAIFGFIFAVLVTLAGLSLFNQGALAQTSIVEQTNQVFLPLISNSPNVGGTIPN